MCYNFRVDLLFLVYFLNKGYCMVRIKYMQAKEWPMLVR